MKRACAVLSAWILAAMALCGCAEEPAPPRTIPRWECPPEWVPHRLGGCGPAVVLCRPGGGGAEGVCSGLDLTRPRPVPYADGGAGATFYLLPDGGIGGAWPEALPELAEVSAGTLAPPEDFAPTAGIPSCPAPWRRLEDGTCEPVFPDTCAPGQRYPDLGPTPEGTTTLHVRQGAIGTPDGTEASPYPTISRALESADGPVRVRIAPGTYRENLTLDGEVTLAGCRRRVTLEGTDPSRPTLYTAQRGARAEVRGLTLRGNSAGVIAEAGAHALLRGVDIVETVEAGILAVGTGTSAEARTRVEAEDTTIQGTRPRETTHAGVGVGAYEGGEVAIARSLLAANAIVAVGAVGLGPAGAPARVTVTDCVVQGTLPSERSGLGGTALDASDGGQVIAVRALVQGNRGAAVHAVERRGASPPARVDLTDCVVRDTLPDRDGVGGSGLFAQGGGCVSARRTALRGNRYAGALSMGLSPGGEASRVDLAECVVASTLPRMSTRTGGSGIMAYQGGVVTASRSLIVGNHAAGVLASRRSLDAARRLSRVELSDCVIRETLPPEPGLPGGFGLLAEDGATLQATGTLVLRNHDVGALALNVSSDGRPAVLELDGCVVRGTLSRQGDHSNGHGVAAQGGARLSARRSLVADNRSAGAFSVGIGGMGVASHVELEGCEVRATLPRESDGRGGYGAAAERGGAIVASRSLFRRNRAFGVGALGVAADSGLPSRAALDDCQILDSLPQESDGIGGVGLTVNDGAEALVTRSLFQGNRMVGVGADGALGEGRAARARLLDCAIRDTSASRISGGIALGVVRGGHLDATRVLASGSREGGAMASGEGSVMTLEDVWVLDNTPVNRRGGFGVASASGAAVTLRRVGVVGTHGAALAALSITFLVGPSQRARMDVEDAFVQRVGPSSIDFDACDPSRPAGVQRAYGAYVSSGSRMNLVRVVLFDGEVAVASFGGAFSWTDGAAEGFRRYLLRGTSVVTPPLALRGVFGPRPEDLVPGEDPTLTEERLPVPLLDPTQLPGDCRGRP
ncbi:MAG: hypothetical protein HY909_26505 [Deltaproteobacteria bacterium]|nr:hypothetical protein [Deltaproteobacteria bacterium]